METETLHDCPACGRTNFTAKGIKAHKCKGKPAPATDPIVALSNIKTALESHRGKLIEHEEAFFSATLGERLKIGLQCLKAHTLFVIDDQSKKGQGRKKKNQVTRDVISPGGFEGWLAEEVPWLKKPTCYKYMTALRGLSLDERATEEQVDFTLETLRHANSAAKLPAPSLKALCDAAVAKIEPPAPPPPEPEQQEFDFLKSQLSHFREEVATLLGLKDQLKGLPDFHRAASARVYSLLRELTGTHWQPSEEPADLASVDPDTITL